MQKSISESPKVYYFKTKFGKIGIVWQKKQKVKILKIEIPSPDFSSELVIKKNFPDIKQEKCREVINFAEKIQAFLKGGKVKFSFDLLELGSYTAFQKKVWNETFRIPCGKVISYLQLSKRVKASKAARSVGTCMARNPFPLIIPCHRVVRSDGTLGGYYGGLEMKKAILSQEGIKFKGNKVIF